MAKKKPNVKWGDDIADVIKMVTKAVRSSNDKKRAQGVRVSGRIVKQLDAQGKKKQAGALSRNTAKALKEPRVRQAPPKPGQRIKGGVVYEQGGRAAGVPPRPTRGNVSGARRSLAKTDADKKAAEKQGSRLLRINTEPQARGPKPSRPGAVRSSDYEADQLRREAAADRRQMGYQPLSKENRAARSASNKEKRHQDWLKKLDKDIANAPTKYRKDAATKARAEYLKKYNAKNKKGRGGSSKSK